MTIEYLDKMIAAVDEKAARLKLERARLLQEQKAAEDKASAFENAYKTMFNKVRAFSGYTGSKIAFPIELPMWVMAHVRYSYEGAIYTAIRDGLVTEENFGDYLTVDEEAAE